MHLALPLTLTSLTINVARLRSVDEAGLRLEFLLISEAQLLLEFKDGLGHTSVWAIRCLQDVFRALSKTLGRLWVRQRLLIYHHFFTPPANPNAYASGSYGSQTENPYGRCIMYNLLQHDKDDGPLQAVIKVSRQYNNQQVILVVEVSFEQYRLELVRIVQDSNESVNMLLSNSQLNDCSKNCGFGILHTSTTSKLTPR